MRANTGRYTQASARYLLAYIPSIALKRFFAKRTAKDIQRLITQRKPSNVIYGMQIWLLYLQLSFRGRYSIKSFGRKDLLTRHKRKCETNFNQPEVGSTKARARKRKGSQRHGHCSGHNSQGTPNLMFGDFFPDHLENYKCDDGGVVLESDGTNKENMLSFLLPSDFMSTPTVTEGRPRKKGRSPSPRHLDRPSDDSDAEMRSVSPPARATKEVSNLKVVVITNLTRNVVESHLRSIFGFYGEIKKVDLPLYGKCMSLTVLWRCDIEPTLNQSWPKSRQGSTRVL